MDLRGATFGDLQDRTYDENVATGEYNFLILN